MPAMTTYKGFDLSLPVDNAFITAILGSNNLNIELRNQPDYYLSVVSDYVFINYADISYEEVTIPVPTRAKLLRILDLFKVEYL